MIFDRCMGGYCVALRARTPRAARGGVALGVGLLAGALLMPAAPAQASIGGCRSDPVVILSDGVTLDLSATIDDDARDVRETIYVLHAPVGTRVVGVVGTDGAVGLTERFYVYADGAAHTYATATMVVTGSPRIGVTATTAVVTAGGTALASARGQDRQWVPVSVAP